MNQAVTFLSDGGDTVRDLQMYLNPQAQHILDWFHISMRLTVMSQLAKSSEADEQPNLSAEIEKTSNASNGISGTGMFTKRSKSWKIRNSLWSSKRIGKSIESCESGSRIRDLQHRQPNIHSQLRRPSPARRDHLDSLR